MASELACGEADDRYRVQVVDRVLDILHAFTAETPELGVSELSRSIGLHKGTVHRLLSALERHHLVEHDRLSGRYHLGLRLWELGNRAVARLELPGPAMPALQQLSVETGETAHLAVLDDADVLYIARVESDRPLRMPSQVGRRAPAHCTASGKLLLAYLGPQEVERIVQVRGLPRFTPETICDMDVLDAELEVIRQRGFAVEYEEHEPGLHVVAAPVSDRLGKVVAAISVAGPSTRIRDACAPALVDAVVRAGRTVSHALGSPQGAPAQRDHLAPLPPSQYRRGG